MRLSLIVYSRRELSWPEWIDAARACEDAGLDGLFLPDHRLGPAGEGSFDAWTLIAALAAETERIRLGTLVSPVTFRSAAALAVQVATADHVADGRIELGIGAGWNAAEHETYGVPFPPLRERFDRLAEQLEEIRRLWAGPGPAPVQERLPIILAGEGKSRALGLAARYADEYSGVLRAPEEFAGLRERLDAAGGEHVRLSLAGICVVTDDAAVAERFRTAAASGANRFNRSDASALIGTADEVGARLREYAAAGLDRVYLRHPAEHGLDVIRRIGAELVPTLT